MILVHTIKIYLIVANLSSIHFNGATISRIKFYFIFCIKSMTNLKKIKRTPIQVNRKLGTSVQIFVIFHILWFSKISMGSRLKENKQMASPSEKFSQKMISFYICLLGIRNFKFNTSLTFHDFSYFVTRFNRKSSVTYIYHTVLSLFRNMVSVQSSIVRNTIVWGFLFTNTFN